MTWLDHPPDFSEHIGPDRDAYYWVTVYDLYGEQPDTLIAHVVSDLKGGFRLRWDGALHGDNPIDDPEFFDLWWPTPIAPPSPPAPKKRSKRWRSRRPIAARGVTPDA